MKIRRIGESAIALSVSHSNTSECVSEIRRCYLQLLRAGLTGIVSLRPGLDTLVVELMPGLNPQRVLDVLLLDKPGTDSSDVVEPLRIPVRFTGKDLPAVAAACHMSVDEIVRHFLAVRYSVWMIGFMPGFPYLGELDHRLHLPRKAVPDRIIPSGSVAIADEYCGIYPFDSPGGWHVIGTTSLVITDYGRQAPFLFSYGRSVEFYKDADAKPENRL